MDGITSDRLFLYGAAGNLILCGPRSCVRRVKRKSGVERITQHRLAEHSGLPPAIHVSEIILTDRGRNCKGHFDGFGVFLPSRKSVQTPPVWDEQAAFFQVWTCVFKKVLEGYDVQSVAFLAQCTRPLCIPLRNKSGARGQIADGLPEKFLTFYAIYSIFKML